MKNSMVLLAALSAALLSACSDKPPTTQSSSTLFKEQREALDKAKAVQQTVDEGAQKTRDRIDGATE